MTGLHINRRDLTFYANIIDRNFTVQLRMQHRAMKLYIGINIGFRFTKFTNQRLQEIQIKRG
ncbi:Uncharacterised protein [Vibrio cholerae]|nr:Uncharacterised protein [Vibrio cholerae]CSI40766.1 Uncharacterised protein [Vibrio cholerae]